QWAAARGALGLAGLLRLAWILSCCTHVATARSPRGSSEAVADRSPAIDRGGEASVLPLRVPHALARKSQRDRGALAAVLIGCRVGHRDRAGVRERDAGAARRDHLVLGGVGKREVGRFATGFGGRFGDRDDRGGRADL